ncbi:ankyrin repeat protein [Seminavis robusta]|uniref:Ankyrin repeat protein n=1 Tax=Seminavis robusta TaxID=568900 RepID=A0A9N8EWP3_9STRA|nr:ankyrin repeat protein [Seminavis robusta]|eukprot:Sro2541_g330670.1 ankyrin repeat protein (279) ;mRNA; f:2960-3796
MASESISTRIGTSTVASTVAAAANTATNDKGTTTAIESPLLFADDLILVQGMLPYVGVGQYAFIGAVNKKMNQLYKEYCTIELKENPKIVKDFPLIHPFNGSRSAEITDTFCNETFCNQQRAEYWLKENSSDKQPNHDQVCNVIARYGNIMVMKWARQQGFDWRERTCAGAARNGHFELLQWLRENGCPWNGGTCSNAAEGGHLEILKWARENDCPWSTNTCWAAAENGHLEIVKWAHANGCPWNYHTCAVAARNGHLEIVKWARENVVHGMTTCACC